MQRTHDHTCNNVTSCCPFFFYPSRSGSLTQRPGHWVLLCGVSSSLGLGTYTRTPFFATTNHSPTIYALPIHISKQTCIHLLTILYRHRANQTPFTVITQTQTQTNENVNANCNCKLQKNKKSLSIQRAQIVIMGGWARRNFSHSLAFKTKHLSSHHASIQPPDWS